MTSSAIASAGSWPGLIARYRAHLPVTDATPAITLLEGDTPLVRAERLAARMGLPGLALYLKVEGANPTGSFKDRGMTMAVSKAVETGATRVICASTGNTSASMAAYAARAGIDSYMLVPAGYVALGKLAQGVHYGARVIQVAGNFDRALELVRGIADRHDIVLVNSVNPFRIEGQKTAAFEIVDALGRAPDILAIPVGNAGNITAYWKGFKEYRLRGMAAAEPRMWGCQASGANACVLGRPVPNPETVATAIRIGNPASMAGALAARDESGGWIRDFSDERILHAYREVARTEGVFCEPASAASVAGVWAAAERGELHGDELVVCTLTGNGLKDPDRALAGAPPLPEALPAEEGAILAVLGLG
ncbi:MAG: threonine synthase [Candidatus Sericytochromatia bacterium]|nr:threonine synthase [Candidatus Tanganyikabacteria bacterium]